MTFVSDLKEKLRLHNKVDFVKTIQDNPEYTKVINKLGELSDKKETLIMHLRKVEYEIDVCLTMIEMIKEKQELEVEEERFQQKNFGKKKEEK